MAQTLSANDAHQGGAAEILSFFQESLENAASAGADAPAARRTKNGESHEASCRFNFPEVWSNRVLCLHRMCRARFLSPSARPHPTGSDSRCLQVRVSLV